MNYSFQLFSRDNQKWDDVVKSAFLYDFHHTSLYHKIDNDFKSYLFYATNGDDFIAMPLVFRNINDTNMLDATSVYGYGGPISNLENFNDLPAGIIDFFKKQLESYCLENNVVSIFSRLHPIIAQQKMFDGFGEVVDLNKTVSIDLKLTIEEQRRQYRKSNKSEINQLKRGGFAVEEALSEEDVDDFIRIYYETMDRVQANPYYYFSKDYFKSFLENPVFGNKLLLVKYEGKTVAGAIFTFTNKIMQYHLAGTTEEFIRQTPMKLLIDEARLLGTSMGLQYLHLGGGVGGNDDDSLFRFKSGFSKDFKQFSVWKHIVDSVKYDMLVETNNVKDRASNFFPLYRS